jgi:hypothetical protein
VMVGANQMQRKGWTSELGVGRHRASSIVFCYIASPTGGEIEYAADGDYVDDDWVPNLWEPVYSNLYWIAGSPPPVPPGPIQRPLPQPIPPFRDIV